MIRYCKTGDQNMKKKSFQCGDHYIFMVRKAGSTLLLEHSMEKKFTFPKYQKVYMSVLYGYGIRIYF